MQAEQGTLLSCDHVVLSVSEFLMPIECLPSRILTSKQNTNTTLRLVRKNLLGPPSLCQSKIVEAAYFIFPNYEKNHSFCIRAMRNYTAFSHFRRMSSLSSVRRN